MKYVISILLEDEIGALSRIVELFTSRGYNIDSICSGVAEKEHTHRMTLVTQGDEKKIKHIIKLLKNVVNIFEVTPLKPLDSISLELMLMKVQVQTETRSQILQMITAFEGTIIEMNSEAVSFQVVGSDTRLDGIISVFREYDIIELSRTGEAAIHK